MVTPTACASNVFLTKSKIKLRIPLCQTPQNPTHRITNSSPPCHSMRHPAWLRLPWLALPTCKSSKPVPKLFFSWTSAFTVCIYLCATNAVIFLRSLYILGSQIALRGASTSLSSLVTATFASVAFLLRFDPIILSCASSWRLFVDVCPSFLVVFLALVPINSQSGFVAWNICTRIQIQPGHEGV